MPLTIESLPLVVTDTLQARNLFIRRLFDVKNTELNVSTWEHTAMLMQKFDIATAFDESMDVFVEFLNNPTKEKFDGWSEQVGDLLEIGGVMDDWNTSAVFMALIMTKFRDLNIAGPIEPFENVVDVGDAQFDDPTAGLCPRAFATVVLALASLAKMGAAIAKVADSLLSEAYDGEEDSDEEEDDE